MAREIGTSSSIGAKLLYKILKQSKRLIQVTAAGNVYTTTTTTAAPTTTTTTSTP